MERAIMCPQCNAPLTPHHFARTITCPYCGSMVRLDEESLSAKVFHEAYHIWNSPRSYQIPSWISIGDSHWALEELISHGEIADIFKGERARWPTELVLIKLLRHHRDHVVLEDEWQTLQTLQSSHVVGADTFTALIPQPVVHGKITSGTYSEKQVAIFRWASGFHHTFEAVAQAYPRGISPQASIWIWRRILEILSFIHRSGIVHGAVLPHHLLVQENEHGVRLVGYGSAGPPRHKLRSILEGYEAYYPQKILSTKSLSAQLDIAMSARCMAAILGGDPKTTSLPTTVPKRLANIIRRIALVEHADLTEDAWSIREELGAIASDVFGPPQFIPIVMPP